MRPRPPILLLALLAGCGGHGDQGGAAPPAEQRTFLGVEYAAVDGHHLLLDLFLPPTGSGPFPTVVWIHGGGWAAGSRTDHVPRFLLEDGIAVASIDYRLTNAAPFPAQILDCKAAVRWLRDHARAYRLDGAQIGASGESAGGHLAALLGTSGGVAGFEPGDGTPPTASRVQAVFDEFGPTDLAAEWDFLVATNDVILQTMLRAFLGGTPAEQPALAAQADPITWVGAEDPPFLIFHGDADPLVPVSQSRALADALKAAGRPEWLYVFPGVGHSGVGDGDALATPEVRAVVSRFFSNALRPAAPRGVD